MLHIKKLSTVVSHIDPLPFEILIIVRYISVVTFNLGIRISLFLYQTMQILWHPSRFSTIEKKYCQQSFSQTYLILENFKFSLQVGFKLHSKLN